MTHSGGRAYWLCQIAGWSAFFCLRTAAAFAVGDPGWPPLVLQAAGAALGLGITHALRMLIHARGWSALPWKGLFARMALVVPASAAVWTALLWPVSEWATGEASQEIGAVRVFLLLVLSQGLFLCVWLGLYFGYQAFQRSQRQTMERLRLERAVSEAELKALKAQVNPHFLFNSLNSVRALIEEDPGRAREAVTQLAALLRFTLQAGSKELVPLKVEFQAVENYLALEKLRHEDRLRYRIEAEPHTGPVELPPLLLQTLVENAVKYGLGASPTGTEVRISAEIAAGQVRLAVENTGQLGARTDGPSTGLGLRNARERLLLLFGPTASLELSEPTPGWVRAEARFPVRTNP